MRIQNENFKPTNGLASTGEKKIELIINFDSLKVSDSLLEERLFETAKITNNDFLSNIYFSFGKFIQSLKGTEEKEDKSFLECLNANNSCTLVYWSCGSCGGDWARVDAYCGSGGSEPDYSFCELC